MSDIASERDSEFRAIRQLVLLFDPAPAIALPASPAGPPLAPVPAAPAIPHAAVLDRPHVVLLRAGSVAAALAMLREQDVALVILQLTPADADPGELCRQLRRERGGRLVPFLCLGAQPGHVVDGSAQISAPTSFLPSSAAPAAIEEKIASILALDAATRRLKRAQDVLDDSRRYFESVIAAVGEGILGLSSEGTIRFANPAAVAMLGSGEKDLIGQRFYRFYPLQGENDSVWQYTPFFNCWMSGTEQRVDDSFFRRAGDLRFPVAFRCVPMDSRTNGLLVVFQDITVRRQLEARLRQQAIIDPLTGLANREGFKRSLSESIARGHATSKSVALLSIDLDRFTRINNTLGHATGDVMLQAVSRRLQECVGEFDMVARVGGDEFAIVLPDLDAAGRDIEVAETVLTALRRPFAMPDGLDITIAASIGIAGFPASGTEVDVVMRCAEVATRQAKTDGRNQALVYAPEMNARASGRMAFEQALRVAVDERSFTLDYQPQIDLVNGNVIGFEALLRWQHDDIGNVSPARFVPMLEETGLIVPVGRWVFEAGCQQRQQWADQLDDACTVSINLSPRQFTDKRLASQIRHILEVNELPAYRLEIELTESMLMLDREYAHGVLNSLKDMGLKLSVDDFGTGYSSLAYLKQFALDALKIDKQFIDQLTNSKRDAAIATSIIQLAHNLGLQVVAEGVETLEQVNLLRELGCDVVQGFYFGRPLQASEVSAFPQKMPMHLSPGILH